MTCNLMSTSFAALVALSAGNAYGASFDCSKAKAPDELKICKTSELSALDSEMGGLWYAYSAMPMLMGSSGARSDDAHQFLRDRATCGADVTCLRKAYIARNQALRNGIKNGLTNMQVEENAAGDRPSASLPAPVNGLIEGYAKQCRALGGTPAADRHPNVLATDLDGDNIPDYLLDLQPMQCDDAATAYSANDGCQIDIALSRQSYRSPASVRGGQPTVTLGADGSNVAIWVDRTQCNLQGHEQACWTLLSWRNGKLMQRHEVRAAK